MHFLRRINRSLGTKGLTRGSATIDTDVDVVSIKQKESVDGKYLLMYDV